MKQGEFVDMESLQTVETDDAFLLLHKDGKNSTTVILLRVLGFTETEITFPEK